MTTNDVARDLTEIVRLIGDLRHQAIASAGSPLMPGGAAMVALGHEANLDEWAENLAYDELHHLTACTKPDHARCTYDWRAADEDDQDHEPPLQTLLFWSEEWRTRHGYPLEGRRPTILSEANFIRHMLDWAWDNEIHWVDFARDIAQARTRLENVLAAGERSERGAPCLYEECRGKRLVRKLEPARGPNGEKVWRYSNWHCPRCHREWAEDQYAAMVTAANEAAKIEVIDGEEWVSTDLAARRTKRPSATIRQWVHKGHVAVACITKGRRGGFVRMSDVRERHASATRRKRAA